MRVCHKCGQEWAGDRPRPGYAESCVTCQAYLHACKNCRFHDPGAHNQCRVPGTEMVRDRAGMNYCDAFEFRVTAPDAPSKGGAAKARAALEQVLGADEAADEVQALRDALLRDRPGETDPRRALDDLFGGGA